MRSKGAERSGRYETAATFLVRAGPQERKQKRLDDLSALFGPLKLPLTQPKGLDYSVIRKSP